MLAAPFIFLTCSSCKISSPYSSLSAFSSPDGSTVKVYSDRVISTMQAPPYSSPSQGRGIEGPSGSPSETVYFPSSQAGYGPLAACLALILILFLKLNNSLLHYITTFIKLNDSYSKYFTTLFFIKMKVIFVVLLLFKSQECSHFV